jgi:hypothetical protein
MALLFLTLGKPQQCAGTYIARSQSVRGQLPIDFDGFFQIAVNILLLDTGL